MSTAVRWVVAAAAVIALVYAMLPGLPAPADLFSTGAAAGTTQADEAVCPASAKKANLDFTVTDMDGKSVKLADYRGKVLVLDFWATWCPPCKAEIPGFVELQNTYGPQGLQVLRVSVDDPADQLKPFASEFKMNYPVLVGLGRDDLLKAYDAVDVLPITWFVKPDGTIGGQGTGLHPKSWFDENVKALF